MFFVARRLLLAFERAEAESDPAARAAWLSFAVVGGGPTGVELAGTLAEIARHTLKNEFRHIDPQQARVRLVEADYREVPRPAQETAPSQVRAVSLCADLQRALEKVRPAPQASPQCYLEWHAKFGVE